jgi:integrase/recombinase XerC
MTVKQKRLTKEKYLSDKEYEKLVSRCEALMPTDHRDATLILLALATGARAQELLNIREVDLDPESRTVFIRGLKGSNDREIPLSDVMWERVIWIAAGKGRKPIFGISYPRLYQIWESLKTCPKKFHALRHTFAVRHLRRTNNLRLIQIALGHAQIQSTMVYASYLMEKDELRSLLLPGVA